MKQYIDMLKHVLQNGEERTDRTGIGTIGVFGYQTRFDLREGFPAVTTKHLGIRSVASELLWILEGSTDERRLAELYYGKPRRELVGKTTIWTANADNQGKALGHINGDLFKNLGPVYGAQLRCFGGDEGGWPTDQLKNVLHQLKNDKFSRRIIINLWDASRLHMMALPPCHVLSQFYVNRDNELSCHLYQRSADAPIGSPYNIASYALLTHILARESGLGVGEFVYSIGDLHIYKNQIEGVMEQIEREPYPLPTLEIHDSFTLYTTDSPDDPPVMERFPLDTAWKFKLNGYQHHPSIKMEMAV